MLDLRPSVVSDNLVRSWDGPPPGHFNVGKGSLRRKANFYHMDKYLHDSTIKNMIIVHLSPSIK